MSQAKLSPIQQAQKHFQSKLSGELKKYTCEEWGMDIYYREIHSLRTESKIVELAQAGKSVEALVQTVLSKALDAEGKPLFSQYDKDALMNDSDPTVVLKISRVLSGGDLPEVSEIEKN
jgi:hypothetical protein